MTRRPKDFDLWLDVTRTIKPLRTPSVPPAGPRPIPVAAEERTIHSPRPSAPHEHLPNSHPRAIPHLTGLDRRTAQRMTRGQIDIEGRLDLHGTGIETARVRLLQFLRTAHAAGMRTALVITGKGDSPYSRHTLHGADHYHAPERQGRLRRLVPEWLHEADFRLLVSGFQPAHPRHGGGGAFYVRIRRDRSGS